MRSTSGQYYPGLDHLRALAAFLVFGWHFTHGGPVPYGGGLSADFLILVPFDEGHCGVALFMTLSGYLFAKLLDGKRIHYANFVWNRFIRLAPLLIVIFVVNGTLIALHPTTHRIDVVSGLSLREYIKMLLTGFIGWTWPNGGWSITVEMHFYLLFPMILWLKRQWRQSLVCVLAGSVILRAVLYAINGEVHFLAYGTIIGRIDQFIVGIIAFDNRHLIKQQHGWLIVLTVGFLILYQYYGSSGGFWRYFPSPSPDKIWIVLPTIEGAYFGFLISYYDNSFRFRRGVVSDLITKIGACSYSIYLLHPYVVWPAARIAARLVPGIHTFAVAELAALGCFALLVPVAWVSYRLIECPFARFRRKYSDRKPSAEIVFGVTAKELAAQ